VILVEVVVVSDVSGDFGEAETDDEGARGPGGEDSFV